jgi:hypothetical protein
MFNNNQHTPLTTFTHIKQHHAPSRLAKEQHLTNV